MYEERGENADDAYACALSFVSIVNLILLSFARFCLLVAIKMSRRWETAASQRCSSKRRTKAADLSNTM